MSSNEKPEALIIGAGGVLGGALVRALASDYRVTATRRSGGSFTALDLADRASCDAFIRMFSGRRIAAFVYNAARADDGIIARQSESVFDDAVGTYLLSLNRIIAGLRDALSGGHIILVSSVVGIRGGRGQAVYSAIKGALIGYAKEYAPVLAKKDIRINAVLPGLFRSNINAGIDDDAFRTLVAENALGCAQDVDEVARFIAYLCGMRRVSGQVFNLDSRVY